MIVKEVSMWGAIIVACLVFLATIALAFIDSKMLRRMLVIFGATVAQMAVVAAVVWLVYQTNAWWAYVLCYLLVVILSIGWCLYPFQSMWKKMLVPVAVSMFAGSIVVAGSAMLCLPTSVFLTVYSVLMACLTASMLQTMLNYQRNMHKEPGARKSWRESILPQVRSMAQPPGDGHAYVVRWYAAGRPFGPYWRGCRFAADSRCFHCQHFSRHNSTDDA